MGASENGTSYRHYQEWVIDPHAPSSWVEPWLWPLFLREWAWPYATDPPYSPADLDLDSDSPQVEVHAQPQVPAQVHARASWNPQPPIPQKHSFPAAWN